jgi:uncharacterized Zn finger protein (UPF0148 family)
MIVMTCPDCLTEHIGEETAILVCTNCGHAFSLIELKQLRPFKEVDKWIREPTEEERTYEELMVKIDKYQSIADRLRRLADGT